MDIQKAKEIWEMLSDEEKARVELLLGHRPSFVEEKPKKAYVIVSGEYSDYTVNAVFLDKEEAERAAEIANRKGGCWYNDHRVLEFDIGVPCDLEKFDLYSAYFDKDGHVTYASKHSWLFSDEVNEVHALTGPYRNHDYCIDVYATDEEHAKKIAADIFAKWKAEKEGIT